MVLYNKQKIIEKSNFNFYKILGLEGATYGK